MAGEVVEGAVGKMRWDDGGAELQRLWQQPGQLLLTSPHLERQRLCPGTQLPPTGTGRFGSSGEPATGSSHCSTKLFLYFYLQQYKNIYHHQ